jgi:hypothetical protein
MTFAAQWIVSLASGTRGALALVLVALVAVSGPVLLHVPRRAADCVAPPRTWLKHATTITALDTAWYPTSMIGPLAPIRAVVDTSLAHVVSSREQDNGKITMRMIKWGMFAHT